MIVQSLTEACAEAKKAVHDYSRNPCAANEVRVAQAWQEVRRLETVLAEHRRWQGRPRRPKLRKTA